MNREDVVVLIVAIASIVAMVYLVISSDGYASSIALPSGNSAGSATMAFCHTVCVAHDANGQCTATVQLCTDPKITVRVYI